jgi:hypothetical protein
MLKRLLTGFFKGLLLGGVLALVAVRGLGMTVFAGAAIAYLAAAVAGVLTGLFAGRPIWAKEAKIEAGLKAAAGAALGVAAMFAVRRWLPYELDLGAWGAGSGTVGSLPATSLPLVSTALAIFFDLDNTDDKSSRPKVRVTGSTDAKTDPVLDDETVHTDVRRGQSRR